MEKCSVRDAAMKLQEWFSIDPATAPTESKPAQDPVTAEKRGEGSEPVNKPLAFELKGIDLAHAYLAERGITKETAETFGVGLFSGRGSMKGRVVIPIHNERGELVAYAGRSIDGSDPRYKLPAGFHKSHVLFNLHRTAGSEVVVGPCRLRDKLIEDEAGEHTYVKPDLCTRRTWPVVAKGQ
jgi:hypothetical protein